VQHRGLLGQVVIIEPGVVQQGGFHVLGIIETVGRQNRCDPAIEALGHAVGLRATRLGEAVLDAQGMAALIKLVSSTGRFLSRAKQAISEPFAIVDQQPGYLDRAGLAQGCQERFGG